MNHSRPVRSLPRYSLQREPIGSWLTETLKVMEWRKVMGLRSIHAMRKDFPRRIVFIRTGMPHSWPAEARRRCDLCGRGFSMWATSSYEWSRLPVGLQRCLLCIHCFRKVVRFNDAAVETPVGEIVFMVPFGTDCTSRLLTKYRKALGIRRSPR